MKTRSEHATSRLPIGFTLMRNKRIEAAIAAVGLQLIKAGKTPPHAVPGAALQIVARTLPFPPHRRSYRTPKPTKNNSAAYRKQTCPAALA